MVRFNKDLLLSRDHKDFFWGSNYIINDCLNTKWDELDVWRANTAINGSYSEI